MLCKKCLKTVLLGRAFDARSVVLSNSKQALFCGFMTMPVQGTEFSCRQWPANLHGTCKQYHRFMGCQVGL